MLFLASIFFLLFLLLLFWFPHWLLLLLSWLRLPPHLKTLLALPFLHRFLTSFTASQQHDSILKGDSSAFLVPGPALMDRLKGLVQLGQCCAPSRKEVEKERGEEGGG